MKKTKLILGIAILFAIGSTAMTGCGSSGQKNEEEAHEHEEDQELHEEEGEEGEHSHSGGEHMGHMNEVQEWLKTELGDKYNDPVPSATEEQLALGKEIFTKNCVACHGESGKGDGPASAAFEQKPADFTDPEHSKYYSDMGRMHIIKNGVEGTPMVGWEKILSENEILSVYTYVRSLRSAEVAGDIDLGEGMYTCSMHPEVSGNKGGKCPKCGMTLIAKKQDDDGHNQ